MSHTPGPWKLSGKRIYINYTGRNGHELTGTVATAQCPVAADVTYEEEQKEASANARLIAAAPDLLNALNELIKACNPKPGHGVTLMDDDPPLVKARAAIAKAETAAPNAATSPAASRPNGLDGTSPGR